MNWLVGVDADPDSRGAIRFGRWLHDVGDQVHAIHAVGRATAGFDNRPGPGADLREDADEVRRFLADHGAAEAFDGVGTVVGRPDRVFASLLDERDFDALIVGRAAAVDESAFVRLGPVVRRSLRKIERPVLVAPPGLRSGDFGRGPVLVAFRPDPDCLAAIAFGRRIGEHFGVDVRLAHVPDGTRRAAAMGAITVDSRDPSMSRRDIVPEPDVDLVRAELERWAREHDVGDLPLELWRGPRVPGLLHAARSCRATVLVCGRGDRPWWARWRRSTSRDLAAFTDRPLAIVAARQAN